MKVSVVIPVFNCESYLEDAIDSVLNQSRRPDEVIVVDDASKDQSVEVARLYCPDIRLVKHARNLGPSAARNTGIKLSTGEVLAFLDADDWWTEKALEKRLDLLQKKPKLDVVLGYTQRTNLKSSAVLCGSVGSGIFRKKVFEEVGKFDETLRYGEDGDLFLRIKESPLHIGTISEIVQMYRMHDSNSTRNKNLHDMGLLEILHRSIRRKNGKNV